MRYLLARQGIIENFVEIDEGADNDGYFALMAQDGVAVAPVERMRGDMSEMRRAELGDGYDAREDAVLRAGSEVLWEREQPGQEPGGEQPPLTALLAMTRAIVDAPAERVNFAVMALALELGYADEAEGEEWQPGRIVQKGDIVVHEGGRYRCLQGHIAQADWAPDIAVSLFAALRADWDDWAQPLGDQDAYMAGDRVSHLGTRWTSDMDNNAWEPGIFGWTEVK